MKKTTIRAAAAATLAMGLIGLAAPASAQSTVDVAWNVGVVSDYVFRGFSQTGEDPAIQGGVDLTSGNFYGGAWASNVDFGDDTDAEFDIYGGYRTEAGGFALDFGVIGYLYAGAPDGADYNYAEFKAAASRAVVVATRFARGTSGRHRLDAPGLIVGLPAANSDESATGVGRLPAHPSDCWTTPNS